MTGTLLDLCLESPARRARSRPSSAPGKARSKDSPHAVKVPDRPRSPKCGVCGRRAAKTGPEIPFEWVKVYQESSNPKHGWKSCKTLRVAKSKGSKGGGSPVETETFDVPPKEFILPPRSRPKPMTRIFQTAEEVEAQMETWRRRVLGAKRNLRCRQASLVDFVDHVLAGAEISSPKGQGDTVKFEPGAFEDPVERGRNSPIERQDTELPEVTPVDKALTLDMNTTFISAADRFGLNQIFGQLSVNGDLYVDRVAEGIEIHEGKGSDKEWVRSLLREHFPGRLYLERSDFIDFVNMYRRHRHAFMQKIFSEVDQDGSKTVSLEEIVVLLGRRGITPVLSCVERIFREVTGERTVRDLSFDEFVQIYDVVQARAGFSESDLVRLRKVWGRYDQDGNQVLSADEVRLALDWQGFVVDSVEVESLVHEVGQRKGLNQHEFLTFMRKYRDNEVQKFMQLNEKLRSDVGENRVSLTDLPRLLEEIGYEDVAPEVLQECAALVHLVNRDMAVGITSLNPTFTFDGIYHFLENLRASHGFINDERVDLRHAFLRFSTEQFSKSGFIEEDDGSSSAPEGDEEARISVLKLFHTMRWLGYQMELWQVVEKMDSIRMVGSATLCQDEFMRVMAVVHKQEIECIKTMLEGEGKQAQASSPQGHTRSMSDGHEADGHVQVTARRLKHIFHHLGYPMATQELVAISKEIAQGYFSQDVWGVAQVLRRHRKKVREKVRKNFGFASLELHHLQEAFEKMGARPPNGKLKGKLLSNAVRELFPGAEKDQQERTRAHLTLKQVTRASGNCEELNFQDFLHIVRLRLDCAAEAKLNQEHEALQSLNFVPEEVTEFRIIFHKIAREEQGSMTGLFGKVSAIPVLSYAAVEAMLTGIAGQCTDLKREALQEILEDVDQEKKGNLYFWEFLKAVRQLMDTNWHNINDEAQKLVFESWAATEADALYNARLAEFGLRRKD